VTGAIAAEIERERFGGLVLVNLFALRATDPRFLSQAAEPVGPENDVYLTQAAANVGAGIVVAAWGSNPVASHRRDAVARLLLANGPRDLWCFGFTAHGEPRHPLYLSRGSPLTLFAGRPA
jgi:hypothetical protein